MTYPLCDGRECYIKAPHRANLRLRDGNKRLRDLCYLGTDQLRRRGVKYRVLGSLWNPPRRVDL